MEEEKRAARRRMNPIWRGVGCVMIVVITLAGYIFSGWFLRANIENAWIYVPPELYRPAFLPSIVPAGAFLQAAVALVFMLFAFAFINFFYAIFFPIQKDETDVGPLKRRPKRPYRR
jgi:hypothetical protein